MILVSNITKIYKNEKDKSLNNVSLKLPDTGLIFITGESGSGKSTLLNMIGLLDKPTNGKIFYNGKNIFDLKSKEIDFFHKNTVSFIYQHYNLIEHATVSENITVFDKSKDIKNILKRVNLENYENKKVMNLSGGEKQRVAIARALIKDSEVLLCDEPTGALDYENGNKVIKILKDVSKEKLVLVVTHNMKFAKKYGDRIIELMDGEVILDNKAEPKEKIKNVLKLKKDKYKSHVIRNIIFSSFKSKFKRNLLTIFAILIGLTSLLLVVSVKAGFKESLKELEENTLASYPLFISATSVDISNELKNIFKSEKTISKDVVNSVEKEHINKIDAKFLNYIDELKEDIKYIQYNYLEDGIIFSTISNNYNDFYKDLTFVAGNIPVKDNDVLLLLDANGNCDKNLLNSIGLKEKEYSLSSLLNYEFLLNHKRYKIVGIAKGMLDTFYYDYNSLFINYNYPKKNPDSFYLFPYNKTNKEFIKNKIKNYNDDLEYTDYAYTISNVSTTFVDAISYLLILFSLISLFVSLIMIYVITHISVIERIKEVGILKSMGFSKHNVKSIFVGESILVSLFASLISVLLVILLSMVLNNIIYEAVSLSNLIKVTVENTIIIITIGILVGYFGSAIPAKKTSKINISNLMKNIV